MSIFVPADSTALGPARVCVMGVPGSGKTSLASTFPAPLVLDLERGAGSVKANRLLLPPGADPLAWLLGLLGELEKAPFSGESGVLTYRHKDAKEPVPVRTVVIDSIDVVQESQKFKILRGRPKMQLEDWDALFNQVYPIALAWNKLPVQVVVVSHVRDSEGEGGKQGVRGFAAQGALKDRLPRWFDYILHISVGEQGRREVLVQPQIRGGYQWTAKDRHRTFAEVATQGVVPFALGEGGLPERKIAKLIVDRHATLG